MNTNLIAVIKRIIAEQGEAILTDGTRLKGYVADYASQESKVERLAFGRCIEYGAYNELKAAPDVPARQQAKAAVALTGGSYAAFASSIFVSGSDVYVAGAAGGKAVYWKNGRKIALTDGTYEAYAYSIFVSGSDVYVAGYENDGDQSKYGRNGRTKYWKNGREVILTDGTYEAYAFSIFVSGSDVYVAG
ncbi:MAG: hypothetical protein LBB78_11405, partial [Spirochaetaceae bacterium]|nr:hypothetical protein [Spirochaetaceae bacterium]